ncbi:MAG: hypothetical protein ACJ71T_01375 [Actinomycetales bacterium]
MVTRSEYWSRRQERQRAVQAQIRKRQRIYLVIFAILMGWASLSAALQTYWIVGITLTLVLLLVVVLPLAVIPLLVRRGQRALDRASD